MTEHATPEMIDAAEANIRADRRAGKITKEQFQKEMLIMANARSQALANTPPQSSLRVTPLDRLEEIAKAQKAYHDRKQHEFPSVDDFLDEEGELHLPADIGPLLSQSSYNGRYSEADWWLSTIQNLKAETIPAPPENHLQGNRWRVFEDTTPGYWGIELENAGNDDDPIMYPIKIHRERVAVVVDAHNAALTTEGQP